MTPDRCKQDVREPGPWPRWSRCRHAAKKDGFCGIHHPDAVKARRDRCNAADKAKSEAERLARERTARAICAPLIAQAADEVATMSSVENAAAYLRELSRAWSNP